VQRRVTPIGGEDQGGIEKKDTGPKNEKMKKKETGPERRLMNKEEKRKPRLTTDRIHRGRGEIKDFRN